MPENPELFFYGNASDNAGRPLPVTTITLRDLFAAFALAGAIANNQICNSKKINAAMAYGQADAMLRERMLGYQEEP